MKWEQFLYQVIFTLYTSYVIQVIHIRYTLISVTKYIVIFKI